jgi:hypothetical protein
MRQSTTAVLWGVFTVTAVATGLGAVGVVRDAVTPPAASALSPEQVSAELASATLTTTPSAGPSATSGRSPSSDPSPSHSSHPGATHFSSPTPAPSSSRSATTGTRPTQAPTTSPSSGGKQSTDATSVTRSLGSRGGSVVATCSAGSVYLKSWSPAPGFRVHEVQRGPASDVEVTFESGSLEVQMHVRCVSGVPVAVSEASGEDAGAESVED